MAGFGPMAFSPFPYGAPASSGVPSGMFVDLFNAQTAAGDKTWTGIHTFNNGTGAGIYGVTIYRPNESGAVDPILQLGSSTAALSAGSIDFLNNSSNASTFTPMMRMTANLSTASANLRFQTGVGLDVGTSPIAIIDFRIPTSTAITVRPLLSLQNANTEFAKITAAGGIEISGGTAPSIKVGASGTAITQVRVYSQALDPASVAALTTAEQTFTVTGLTTDDKVFVNKPTNTAGLGIVNARVSAADTLAITFGNFTAAPIDAASETYTITAIRS